MSSAPPEGEDAALVERALQGDQRAFSALMRRHKEKLYRFVRAYVGDGDEAFDLVQESFVAAWAALARYDGHRLFEIWLRRIALNKCRDWSRRRAVRRFFFTARSLDDPGVEAAAEVSIDSDEPRLAALETAIAKLPAALKEPLVLTALDGLSQKDAAAVLGISPKAVETRVYRARTALAQALSAGINEG